MLQWFGAKPHGDMLGCWAAHTVPHSPSPRQLLLVIQHRAPRLGPTTVALSLSLPLPHQPRRAPMRPEVDGEYALYRVAGDAARGSGCCCSCVCAGER